MIHLRPVTLADADILLEWRNDPVVRAASRSTDEVTAQEHASWLVRMIESPHSWLFIGVDEDDHPVGHTRVIEEGGLGEVSIVVAPHARGRGLGAQLLNLTHNAYAASGGGCELRAFVRTDNASSHRLFLSAGYVADELTGVGTWYSWSGRAE